MPTIANLKIESGDLISKAASKNKRNGVSNRAASQLAVYAPNDNLNSLLQSENVTPTPKRTNNKGRSRNAQPQSMKANEGFSRIAE